MCWVSIVSFKSQYQRWIWNWIFAGLLTLLPTWCFLWFLGNIATCCVNCNLVGDPVIWWDTNEILYLLHHFDYWLSFWVPTWESKSVWINRSHIRGQHTWAILFCSCKFWALILFRDEKTLYHTVYITKKKDLIQSPYI